MLWSRRVKSKAKRQNRSTLPVKIGISIAYEEEQPIIILDIEDISAELEAKRSLRSMNLLLEKMVKRRTDELHSQYVLFETLFEKSPDGIMIADEDNCLQCNEKMVRLFGFDSKDELADMPLDAFWPQTQPDGQTSRTRFSEMRELAFEHGGHQFEWSNLKRDKESFQTEITLTPVTLHDQHVLHIVIRDITEVKKTEALNRQLGEQMDLALKGSNQGVWDWNILDDTIYFSARWKAMLGYSDDELPNEFTSWLENVHPDDLEETLSAVEKNTQGETDFYETFHRMRHKDGHWVWIHDLGNTTFDDSGKAVRMSGTHTDVTEQKELELSYAHQAQIIEQVHDAVISIDLDKKVLSWNNGADFMLGYSTEEMIGRLVTDIYYEKDLPLLTKMIDEVEADGNSSIEIRMVKKDGTVIYTALSCSLLYDENDRPVSLIGYAKDITTTKLAQDRLRRQKELLDHQAHHDELTQLPNRTLFDDRLQQGIESAKRNKKELALFFIDLDHFKQINDSLGHAIGDKLLQKVTRRLLSQIRKHDTLARLGGDEFTLIMEELTDERDASKLAKKLLKALKEPITVDGHILYITSSIGISLYPKDDTQARSLLKYADRAMYRAKEEGRNNFQFYSTEMTELIHEKAKAERELRQAIDKRELIVYYQPQMNAQDNTIIGLEALIRWRHPTQGVIPPADFLPLAKETGLIDDIDRWVMNTAMAQIHQWQQDGHETGRLALNIGMSSLEQKGFLGEFNSSIKNSGLNTHSIELEVTESDLMQRPEQTIARLNEINRLGVTIAIDDFGTGHSSLGLLKRLPIERLKIDKSFIDELPDDETNSAITSTIIAMGKNLSLHLIAEGVETREQNDFLIQHGCNTVQGYYYARPMPAQEIEKLF